MAIAKEIECWHCGFSVPSHRRDCPSCGEDNGYPNVRVCQTPQEVEALDARYSAALVSTAARGVADVAAAFEAAVARSSIAISRRLATLANLVSDSRASYVSFQREVAAGIRDPLENKFDKVRTQYEEALYPHFSSEIIFGSLTTNDRGIASYGGYTMILKADLVSRRTSIFEENPHKFVERHHILAN
ncbi:MAG: hypothetical protein ABIQ30_01195 [Devosia sp.]